jgi:hypothetical protein
MDCSLVRISKPSRKTFSEKKRKHRKKITFKDISAYFDRPLHHATEPLGVSLTQLKRLCREFQIPKWP